QTYHVDTDDPSRPEAPDAENEGVGETATDNTDSGQTAAEQPTTSEPASEPKAEETVTTPPAPPASTAESPDGIHLVIAGNFLERANADKRARQLREKGFTNAEVVNFQLSQYHTVCAGRYHDLAEARRMAKKLKDYHSIDAYVRNGN
ncbi:MAG: SPOR domain-containing protein, partial [Saprospiraceae bacterium]|nr:SPOR domain-containing protein [Saprospiraceae bacterium]